MVQSQSYKYNAFIRYGVCIIFAGVVGSIIAPNTESSQLALSFIAQLIYLALLSIVVAGLSRSAFLYKFITVSLMVFLGWFLNVAVELTIFSLATVVEILAIIALGGLVSIISAGLISWLFEVTESDRLETGYVRNYFSLRAASDWTLRIIAGTLIYCGVYFLFGSLVYPFVAPYYVSGELGLTLPDVEYVILVQLIRAPIYILSLWMFIIGSTYSRLGTIFTSGVALFVLGGLTPLLGGTDWPVALRIFHGIEIFFQNFSAGLIIAWLLLPPNQAKQSSNFVSVSD